MIINKYIFCERKQCLVRILVNNIIKYSILFHLLFLLGCSQSKCTEIIKIDGQEKKGEFGRAVTISGDGSTIAILKRKGERYKQISSQVAVYKFKNNELIQKGKDFLGSNTSDMFGRELLLSNDGNRIIIGGAASVGQFSKKGGGAVSGAFEVYDWRDNTWIQVGKSISGFDLQKLLKNEFRYTFGRISINSDASLINVSASEKGKSVSLLFQIINDEISFLKRTYGSRFSKNYLSKDGKRLFLNEEYPSEKKDQKNYVPFISLSIEENTLKKDLTNWNTEQTYSNEPYLVLAPKKNYVILSINDLINNEEKRIFKTHIQFFKLKNGIWEREHYITQVHNGNSLEDNQSFSISDDLNVFAVGWPEDLDDKGRVNIYTKIDDEYVLTNTLEGKNADSIWDGDVGSNFGYDLELNKDGSLIVIGSKHESERVFHGGRIQVFQTNL